MPEPVQPRVSVDDYMKNRVDEQIDWYSGKASKAKKRYYILSITQIVVAAFLPLLAGFADYQIWGYDVNHIMAAAGVIIAVNGGLLTLFRFQEIWTEYRMTSESLKQQKYLFQAAAPPYDTDDAYTRFAADVEGLISGQNASWRDRNNSQRTPNDKEKDRQ